MSLCERATVLASGAVNAEGTPAEVAAALHVIEAYLAIRDVSFTMPAGQAVGANGAGKTSRLKVLMGLLPGRSSGCASATRIRPRSRHGTWLARASATFPRAGTSRDARPARRRAVRRPADTVHRAGVDVEAEAAAARRPSMGLSPELVEDILTVLQWLGRDGLSTLLVAQNAKLTLEATTSCLVVENGAVAMTGSSSGAAPRREGTADLPWPVSSRPAVLRRSDGLGNAAQRVLDAYATRYLPSVGVLICSAAGRVSCTVCT